MLSKILKPRVFKQARQFSGFPSRSFNPAVLGGLNNATFPGLSGNPRGLYKPLPHEEDSRPINPRFWTGTSYIDPALIQVDCSKFDMNKILSARNAEGDLCAEENAETDRFRAEAVEKYNRHGVVYFINTGQYKSEAMTAMTRVVRPAPPIVYKGGANMRSPVEKNVYDTGAPMAADILYHNEIAYLEDSIKWVAFGALEATGTMKGATFLGSGVGATERMMQTELGEKLRRKGLCYMRKLPDQKFFIDNNLDSSIVYNFWQTSTLSNDMDEAAEIMRQKGLEVEWEESPMFGRYMVTKFYTSAFEYDPWTDSNLLYSSVADDYAWFDTWPGVMDLPHQERPLKLNFGDGEVITREEKQMWHNCFADCGVPVPWTKGELAVICNYRWLHGRPGYSLLPGEKRELGVILGETYTRQHELPGKWNQFTNEPIDESVGAYQHKNKSLPRLETWDGTA